MYSAVTFYNLVFYINDKVLKVAIFYFIRFSKEDVLRHSLQII